MAIVIVTAVLGGISYAVGFAVGYWLRGKQERKYVQPDELMGAISRGKCGHEADLS